MKRITISLIVISMIFLVSCSDKNDHITPDITSQKSEQPTTQLNEQEETITPESIKIGTEDFFSLGRILEKTDRSFFTWSYYAFWIDSDGNNVIAVMEPGESVSAIHRYRAVTTNAESFSEITEGMSIYEVVERVGIPYYTPPYNAERPMDFRSSDGIEYRMYFLHESVCSVEQLDNNLDGAILKLENTISEVYSLDNFKLHRIYLEENVEMVSSHELDYDLIVEGVYGVNEEKWSHRMTLYDFRNNDKAYYDANNYYLVYNKIATKEHTEIILDMPTELMNGVAYEIYERENNQTLKENLLKLEKQE